MSMCGCFYAITDDQMDNLLDGSLSIDDLRDDLDKDPARCFSDAEYIWFELTEKFGDISIRGVRSTDRIPEGAGVSYSGDVRLTASELAGLAPETLRQMCEGLTWGEGPEEVVRIANALIAFYQQAAQRGDAVLFRIT